MKKITLLALPFAFAMSCISVSHAQNGIINTFAGTGVGGYSGDGGPAVLAKLDSPQAVAIDHFGNVYISANATIRKVSTAGIITTIAGNGIAIDTGDGGPATAAELYWPKNLVLDAAGNIYISDGERVRKINTAGIINTIAGSGVSGYSGDGGSATAALLDNPMGIEIDAIGNIYISDANNNCIRKINASGVITTIAGNGTPGYGGDGGPATTALLKSPAGMKFDNSGNLLIADYGNRRIRKISPSGIISTIAGNGTYGVIGDGGPAVLAQLLGPNDVTVDKSGNIFFADGNNLIREVNSSGKIITVAGMGNTGYYGDNGFAYNAGLYPNGLACDTLKNLYIADGINNRIREIKQLAYVGLFLDLNSNCLPDVGEPYNSGASTIEVDSNNIAIDTISATSSFNYNTPGNAGDVYTFKLLTTPTGIINSCPASGIISDTLHSLHENYFSKNIAFDCISTTDFDLAIKAVVDATGRFDQVVHLYVMNNFCVPANAVVTVNFSPKYFAVISPSFYFPMPTSISGNTLTWDFTGLSYTTSPYPINLSYWIFSNPSTGILTVGDTVQTHVTITPITGDINPANNVMTIIDTVRAGVDLNEMLVTPSGYIPSGTQLQYNIGFENTGNDTAFNIYIIDSLSDNVDPKSLRIIASSASMNTTILHSGTTNILKFDFPNIDLLDSSHHGQCNGMVSFTVNTLNGLPNGTTIFNRAGIYFDGNPVVTTNTVEDIIGLPNALPVASNNPDVHLYPNPTTNELTIKTDQTTHTSLTITNTLGQLILQQPITTPTTKVNIAALPAGLYYISLKGDNGNVVRKFVKM